MTHSVDAVRDGDFCTVSLPDPGPGRVFRVNGEVVSGGRRGGPVLLTTRGLPLVEVLDRVDVVTSYKPLAEGLDPMSPAAWEAEEARLLSRGRRSGDGEIAFADAADEVALLRLRRKYAAEKRTEWIKIGDAAVAVSDKVPAVPFVVPKRLLGGDYMSSVAHYDRPGYMLDWLRRRLAVAGCTEKSGVGGIRRGCFAVFHNSGELSLHLPGNYHRKMAVYPVSDTHSDVMQMRDRDTAMLEDWVSEWLSTSVMGVNAAEVSQDLRDVRQLVQRLGVKAASSQEHRRVLAALDELIAKVVDAPTAAKAA